MSTNQRKSQGVIAVSGTGGVGATTIALNLALVLQKQQEKVLLVDVDRQLSNLRVFVDLPKKPLADYPQISDKLPAGFGLFQHESGLILLLAPYHNLPVMLDSVFFMEILPLLRQSFDLTICDFGRHLDDYTWVAWERADVTLMVGELTMQSMFRLRMMVDTFSMTGKGMEKLLTIINQSHQHTLKRQSMKLQQASDFTKHPLEMEISFNPQAQEAINKATPLANLDEGFRKDMERLGELLIQRLHK